MSNATLRWFAWRLTGLLPDEDRIWLLRACLEDGRQARLAWQQFLASAQDPKGFFEHASGALKGLLPFVELGLTRNGIEPGRELSTYLRVAVIREELRDQIYREVFHALLARLADRVDTPIVLRGLALAQTCYSVPSRRHNHGIDLLLRPEELLPASRLLCEAGIEPAGSTDGVPTIRHIHESGLPVTLHTRLFELPHLQEPITAIRRRAREFDFDGSAAAVLDPADHLLHVCGRAAYSGSRANLRWVCDAVLLARNEHHIDWDAMVCDAGRIGLGLPMALALDGLRNRFTVPIPESVVHQLQSRHGLDDVRVRHAVHTIALECPMPRSGRSGRAPVAPGAAWRFALFRLLPSKAYIRWKYEVDGMAATTWSYVRRILRYVRTRAMRRTRHLAT